MDNLDKTDIGISATALPESGLGDRIRDAREKRGLSQEGLSRLTKAFDVERQGISRTVLTGYEKGKFKPGTRELRILYQALGLTPNWLILGQSDPERMRGLRAKYETEEEFDNKLLEAIKRLDSESLNGVAHLIFSASANASEIINKFESIRGEIENAQVDIIEASDVLIKSLGKKTKRQQELKTPIKTPSKSISKK
ncbi:MAG: hypothetical protein A3H31_02715 [Gallionellales bacterium RIFCSPLOWO2_02_FULL_57_47]|nr:MAG: hypothetical protein A3H31_02715 [Gallionellales bacterium RIFCSPLOWO2_02_FULL_57_47]OGT17301.1 MAG: hypothetical protein A3J49_02240 [Gallionellales bacterium RIFCSPHIGHO2_02_FULL_57_16]